MLDVVSFTFRNDSGMFIAYMSGWDYRPYTKLDTFIFALGPDAFVISAFDAFS
jgi:hypothetical protein